MDKCSECENIFVKNRKWQKFCSLQCGRNFRNKKSSRKGYFCKDCGNSITRFSSLGFCRSCSKKNERHPNYGNFGKLSFNYINGNSFLPYSEVFNKELKDYIRKRDNYTCQNCSMNEEEHLIVHGQALHVHHVNYNKQNCKEDNLITLCIHCNVRANYNRNYWEKIYNNKIKEIYYGDSMGR